MFYAARRSCERFCQAGPPSKRRAQPANPQHYRGLPEKLQAQGIDPRVPWRYNFKLDFRFK